MKRRGAEEQGSRGAGELGGRTRPTLFSPAPPLPRSPALLQAALAGLVSLWLYRRALALAYFNDDPTGHFAWMEGRAVVDFFTGAAAYGYYRPVVFTALRLFERLFGGDWPHNPFADHALLLLLHAANAALVWGLVRALARPAGRRGAGALAWVAAVVFTALPFSYEAVAYVASLTHPLATFWLLAALHLHGRALATTSRRLPAALWSLPAAVLALLTHENGLFVLPALLGLDWLLRPADAPADRLRRLWPVAVAAALYVTLWLAIPKDSDQGLNALAGVAGNAVPFLQTLVFPLLPLLQPGAGDVAALAAVSVGFVAIVGLLARRAGAGRLWAFALGWLALSALPSLLFLSPAYVYGSPRLSYLPAVGVGLLWGLPLLALLRNRVSQRKLGFYATAAVGVVYALALLLPARSFVACQLDFYVETSRLAREMGRIGAAAPAGREIVFVNAPFFFGSTPARPDGCPSPYPWTPTGGVLIPPYAQPRDFVRFNGGPDRAASGVTFAGYAPGWRTFGPEIGGDGLRAAVAGGAVYVFDLGRGAFIDLSTGWRPGGASDGEPRATFGGALALVGGSAVATGDRVHAQLDWRVLSAPPFLPAVFIHIYDAAGALAAQSDGPPANGLAPIDLWAPGDGLADTRVIDVSGLPPGEYRVVAGVYDPRDGARLPAERDGQRLADDVFPLSSFVR